MSAFFKKLGQTFADLFTSKKFLVAAGATVAAIANGQDAKTAVLAAGSAYILGQGIADHGKNSAPAAK